MFVSIINFLENNLEKDILSTLSSKKDIADVVLIKCYIINPNEYKLSAQGFANADVHGSSNGLNAQDAVAIAKHILHVIPSLSELK